MKFLKNNELVSQVYNDGIIRFFSTKSTDKYGTPISGGQPELKDRAWYRRINARSEDIFYARSLGQDIDLKIAIPGDFEVDTKWVAKTNKNYEIYQIDYNSKNDETIISLKEV